jgi:hypothetical protein
MPYVYSTATNSIAYTEYEPDNDKNCGFARVAKKVIIMGGHGLATKALVTPKGMVTRVSDEDLEFLLKNQSFQRHVKAGFMVYDKNKVDPEKKVINMAKADGCSPLTPDDFKEGQYSTPEARIYMGQPARLGQMNK